MTYGIRISYILKNLALENEILGKEQGHFFLTDLFHFTLIRTNCPLENKKQIAFSRIRKSIHRPTERPQVYSYPIF